MPRPAPRFHDFIGQKVVDLLRRQLAGPRPATSRFRTCPSTAPRASARPCSPGPWPARWAPTSSRRWATTGGSTLSDKLARLRCNDFLLIDECHRLGPGEQELLCEAIDHGSIPAPEPKPAARQVEAVNGVSLPPWTLVLATDQPGRLLNALHKRIDLQVALCLLSLERAQGDRRGPGLAGHILISPQAARLVAEASAGCRAGRAASAEPAGCIYPESENQQLGVPEVREFLDAYGFDEAGLNRQECRYLEAVARLGSARWSRSHWCSAATTRSCVARSSRASCGAAGADRPLRAATHRCGAGVGRSTQASSSQS